MPDNQDVLFFLFAAQNNSVLEFLSIRYTLVSTKIVLLKGESIRDKNDWYHG